MKSAGVLGLVLVLSGLLHAQAPAPAATQPAASLPVRRVVLYKSGVGYFEHLGRVRGSQTITIDFTSGQLDDVLKSLTALDLDGGRVSGVSYNSEAGFDRRLGALRLPVAGQTTRAQFLNALRGARLDVRAGLTRVTGRLLSVERMERKTDAGVISVDTLSIVSDAGEIQTVALDPGVTVRLAESDVSAEVGKYLSLVASVRDQDLRRLSIATTGSGDRDLFVSYVSEVPVWKATYRLVLPGAGDARKPLLQGWAIVDNTVGTDWENVQLSLVAGAPQSFVQAISRPYYVQRPVVPLPERVLLSPQTHQSAISTGGSGALTGTVTDTGGGVIPGATVRVTRAGNQVAQGVTDRNGRYQLSGIPPGVYEVAFQLQGFRTLSYGRVDVNSGMETVLNGTMEVGAISEAVTVTSGAALGSARGVGAGRAGGAGGGRGSSISGLPSASINTTLDAMSAERAGFAMRQQQVDATAGELGDLFEYKLKEPVTIRKNQSALVPILSSEVQAEKVSLWNQLSGARALRAIWLTNGSGNTLDGGSFSIVEGQAFAGEGLIDPLKAGERRLVSYAVDLALALDMKPETLPTRLTKVSVSRGLVIQQTEERQRHLYSARNEDSEPRTLVVEHPARPGWSIGGTVKPAETTAGWHRFRITVAPRTTATFTVEETRPNQAQVSVASITDDHVALFVREQTISGPLEAALRQVLSRKAEIARLSREIATREREIEQIGRDQDRVRENMKSLKGSSEERQLVQRYVKQLNDQETRIEVLRRELATLTAERQKAQADLDRFIEGMST